MMTVLDIEDYSTQKQMSAINRIKFGFTFYLLLAFIFFDYFRPQNYFPLIGQLGVGLVIQGLLLLCLLVNHNLIKLRNVQTKCFLGLVLLMIFHIPTASNTFWALQYGRTTVAYFIVYLCILAFVDSIWKIERFVKVWIMIVSTCAVVGLMSGGKVPNSGFMGDENDFALCMDLFLPLAYFMFMGTSSIMWRLFYITAIGLFLTANIASFSRGGFVGLIPVVFVCWFKTPKKLVATFIVLLMLGVFYLSASPKYWERLKSIQDDSYQRGTGEERVYLWKCAWSMFLSNPVVGVGQGNYPWVLPQYEPPGGGLGRSHGGQVAHSLYFTLLPELGIVGVILYFGMVLFSFKDLKYIFKLKRDNKYLSIPVQNQIKDKSWMVNKMRFISLGVIGALVGYLFAGAFISVLYYPHFWMCTSIVVAMRNIYDRTESVQE